MAERERVEFGPFARCRVHTMADGCECRWDDCVKELQTYKIPTADLNERARIAEAPTEPTGAHHHYLSTACYHGAERPELHAECQKNAKRWDGTPKVAGQCKYCEARCLSLIHI